MTSSLERNLILKVLPYLKPKFSPKLEPILVIQNP